MPTAALEGNKVSQTAYDISVIICAYTEDRWNDLIAAIESVQQQTLPSSEVIVMIDHNPGLMERIKEYILGVIVVENTESCGLSGRNRGIANATYLTEHLKGAVQTPVVRPRYRHVYHQYTIRILSKRNECITELRAKGIETTIHYPIPIHQQPFYRRKSSLFRVLSPGRRSAMKVGNPFAQLPATESAVQQELSLPVHPALSQEDLSTIVREVVAVCK
jgi:hypothetical protein